MCFSVTWLVEDFKKYYIPQALGIRDPFFQSHLCAVLKGFDGCGRVASAHFYRLVLICAVAITDCHEDAIYSISDCAVFFLVKTTLVKVVPRKETCIWCSSVHTKTNQRPRRFPRNSEILPVTCSHFYLSWVSSALNTVYHSLTCKSWDKRLSHLAKLCLPPDLCLNSSENAQEGSSLAPMLG